MSAQISFLDGTYTLIHIPLDLYPIFLQPILRILLPQTQNLHIGHDSPATPEELEGLTPENQHGFLNISVTPLECSIVCHTAWAKNVIEPIIQSLPAPKAKTISVTDSYLVLSVISAGLEAASRVLELTSPLALAGIPIFFITTYYSDFILAPARERQHVISALRESGFELSENSAKFIHSPTYSRKNSAVHHSGSSPPGTPPPSNDNELQSRTFKLLQNRHVSPYVDDGLELIQCSGREISQLTDAYGHRASVSRHAPTDNQMWIENVDTKLYTSIISALVSQPRFISVTLMHEDPPSLLLDKSLLGMFSDSLIGDMDNILIPIFLDLLNLPSEVTGIVCGISGRLVDDMNMSATSELSYLSTARAGVVILPEEQSTRALNSLKPLLGQDDE